MNPRALLSALLLVPLAATPALAQGPAGYIRTDEVRPLFEEMLKEQMEAQQRKRRVEDVVAKWQQRATDTNLAPRDRAKSLFVYGHLLAVLQRNADAVAAWREALKTFPAFPDAHVALGRMALGTGDLKAANRHAKEALKVHASHLHGLVLKAEIAEQEGDLAEAEHWFGKAVDEDPTQPMALQGLALTLVRRYRETFNADRKQKFADGARRIVDTWVSMEPGKAYPRVFQAQIYYSLDLRDEAAQKLEATLTEVTDLSPRDRKVCLDRLFRIRAEQGDVNGSIGALTRMVKIKELTAEERENYTALLNDLEAKGLNAFLHRQVQELVKVMSNRGHSATVRREAMRRLHQLLTEPKFINDPDMEPVINEAWKACVRTLSPPTPPELAIDMLEFFRRFVGDPKIIRIVVHFVGPQRIDSGVTENVRVEATRTLADLGKIASVPSLLFTLRDDSRAVTRAIDVALCDILERRSMIQPGAGPVTEEEQGKLRRGWDEWKHTANGNRRLAESLNKLAELTAKDQRFNRKQQRNPLADHVIAVVLLDNDVGWEAWEAGYLFLREFLGRDFLPPDQRGKVVTPALRPVLYDEIKKWWHGDAVTQEEADQRKDDAGAEDSAVVETGTKGKKGK